MIVKDQPTAWQLFIAMHGSIVPKIIGKILWVALISAVVVAVDRFVLGLPHVSIVAMGIFGVALPISGVPQQRGL
jgi:ion channel-forming bestrophin family protein